jgi:methionyl-tRNA formyltransferase
MEDGRIDWPRRAPVLANPVRAFTRGPGAAPTLDGRALFVGRARARADASGAPGTVLEAGERWLVAAGDGALELLEVQTAGKRRMAAADFLRGARVAPGERLG